MPGSETFRVDIVKRISTVTEALAFLQTIEDLNRFSHKYIVLDCSTEMAKQIVVSHVRDVKLGKRTYHYLLSGLVSKRANNFRRLWFMTRLYTILPINRTSYQSMDLILLSLRLAQHNVT